eukprot:14370979-Heterocapsa_arctica.AAC.1
MMIALAGRHARTARRELFRKAPAQLEFGCPGVAVCLDDVYRHLGGAVARDGCMGPEVAARRGETAKALGPLRKAVFRRRGLPAESKIVFGESLALSRLYFNAAVWERLSGAQLRGLQTDTLQVYRGAYDMPFTDPTRPRAPKLQC